MIGGVAGCCLLLCLKTLYSHGVTASSIEDCYHDDLVIPGI